jgi:HTH-type transcriptional regulator/antitoxin HigA
VEAEAMTALARLTEEWKPNWATHPGEHLLEHLEARGLSQAQFARLAGLSPKLVSTIMTGTNPVTAETAIKLERVLGVKADIWTGIQARWDLFQARVQANPVSNTRSWLSQFPLSELRKRSCLPDTKNEGALVDALLRLFEIGTPQAYPAKLSALAVHHRRAQAHDSSEHHVFTWLMLGEHKARQMSLPRFEADRFIKAVRAIRNLTTEGPAVFEPRMKQLCCEAGVALVFEPPISKTCLFGSARWFDADRAIIQLSLRMKTNDHFWWTFFHEAAHIRLHRGRNFLDDQNGVGDGAEEEADNWAEEILVGRQRFAAFKATRPRSRAVVTRFSREIGLHPGIVVGMLQHARALPFGFLNDLKAKFQWADEKKTVA